MEENKKHYPLVTVLMPCYNAMPYLPEALDSIINQTHTNLEILCINDGSLDKTPEVLEKYAKKDPRIRVIHNETNLNLIATLNKGVKLAKGEFIARMDADDIAFPERIEKQLTLCQSKQVDLVGSNIISISQSGEELSNKHRTLVNQHEIEFGSYFFTPFIHPAVMGRAKLFVENPYSTDKIALHAEDYELWTRIVFSNYNLYNLDEPLLKLRVNQGSVSRKYETKQIENFILCANRHQNIFLNRSIPIEHTLVSVCRVSNGTLKSVHAGVKLLNEITSKYLSSKKINAKSSKGIKTISDMQKADITIQLVKKGKFVLKTYGGLIIIGLIVKNAFNQRFKNYVKSKF